LEIAVILGNN